VRFQAVVETWGSTAAERAAPFQCDDLIEPGDTVLYRGVDVEAPAELVFRWICQLRVAPYSYDWVDNFGRRSPRRLTPGLEQLETGQRVATIFRLVDFEAGRSITIASQTAVFGRVVVSYVAAPRDAERSRLVVKLAFEPPAGLYGWVARKLLPAGDLVMMRKQLITLKSLAERDACASGNKEP
jgi:hypothetical protein